MTPALELPESERALSGGRPTYLDDDRDPVFAIVHEPARARRESVAVVICAPFGWDELATHRSLRACAGMLADAGHAVVRFDLPGSGDSGGSPRDDDLLDRWTTATARVAAWLHETTGCERVAAVGIGLGGMLACRAAAAAAAIDDLVLWAVPSRGSMLVRELRAFARMVPPDVYGAADSGETPEVTLEDGSLNAAGFVLTPQTLAALEGLDLCALPIPAGAGRRVLLLGRDTLTPDRKLRDHLQRSGAAVTVADGAGYSAMATHPQLAQPPIDTFAQMIAWLSKPTPARDSAPPVARIPAAALRRAAAIELSIDGVAVRESPFEFSDGALRLCGILAEPVAALAPDSPRLAAVLLNAGAVRRIGPHRMWVQAARRWAALGVPTLRFDAIGLGDSDSDQKSYVRDGDFYREAAASQVIAALDALQARGVGDSFVVAGLCSGAYWGLHAALADTRIRSLGLVNLRAWFWSDSLEAMRDARRARTVLRSAGLGGAARVAMSNGSQIPRILRTRLRAGLSLRGARATGSGLGAPIARSLDSLRDGGVDTLLLLSRGEPLYDDFAEFGVIARLGQWPNLRLERIPLHDHVVRPLWAQTLVHAALDALLQRALNRASVTAVAG